MGNAKMSVLKLIVWSLLFGFNSASFAQERGVEADQASLKCNFSDSDKYIFYEQHVGTLLSLIDLEFGSAREEYKSKYGLIYPSFEKMTSSGVPAFLIYVARSYDWLPITDREIIIYLYNCYLKEKRIVSKKTAP